MIREDARTKVSVVTAAHNAADVIDRAVRSVAGQTRPVHEHVIVDDGSTDGTRAVVDRLREEFPHISYVYQLRAGPAVARNRGIDRATGRLIAFVDSDDWWLPQKLEHQVAFMESTGAVFTYGDYEKRDARTGNILARYELPESLEHEDLLGNCPIGCLTAAYDQSALGKRYMPDVRRGQDWGLWLALTRDGTTAYKYPGNHAVYNESCGSLSSGKVRKAVDVFRIYRREEGFGFWRSARYLWRHVINAARKS